MENETKEQYVSRSMNDLLLTLGENPETFRNDKPENDYVYRSLAAGFEQAYETSQEWENERAAEYEVLMKEWENERRSS
jgi:hypothetical protein